jgi:hypothetical protein
MKAKNKKQKAKSEKNSSAADTMHIVCAFVDDFVD